LILDWGATSPLRADVWNSLVHLELGQCGNVDRT
jgi:hypothetical protein